MTIDTQRSEFVLVPREPNMAMCNAAVDHTGAGIDMDWSGVSPQSLFRRAWFAMLTAAPTPPKVGTGELDAAGLDETLGALEGFHGNGWINISMKERRLFASLLREHIAKIDAALAAPVDHPEVVGTPHPDDLAVDRFAAAMKAKLALKREQGRSGWEGADCTALKLSDMLRAHFVKGDPLDVGNLAMMIHQRGERIS